MHIMQADPWWVGTDSDISPVTEYLRVEANFPSDFDIWDGNFKTIYLSMTQEDGKIRNDILSSIALQCACTITIICAYQCDISMSKDNHAGIGGMWYLPYVD